MRARGRLATRLVERIRAGSGFIGGLEEFLHAYSLTTREGLALMALAEALPRVPDAETADQLIEDKLGSIAEGGRQSRESDSFLVSASAWALGMSARFVRSGENPGDIIRSLTHRVGMPAVRTAARQAVRVLGHQFVLGQTIEEAIARAGKGEGRMWRYSYDMLGEGARTAADAESYLRDYEHAIGAIGNSAGKARLPARPGISVKLSALHPRYEARSRERVLAELVPNVLDLARLARGHDLNFTIDAEEADRLELSLEVAAKVLADPSLAGWDGFGIAVQAYQKRATAVIRWLVEAAESLDRQLMVRLVKGAYWDSEIKRAQERGLDDYPLFTRKSATDLSFLACTRMLMAARPRIFPQIATHNALAVASTLEIAGGPHGFEFQRLHGMGEALYRGLKAELPDAAVRVYAPVGEHRDLLAYLVRRLLENGANSSFVSAVADPEVPIPSLLRRPAEVLGGAHVARHRAIPLPRDIYAPERKNSRGVEFGERAALEGLVAEIRSAGLPEEPAASIVAGAAAEGRVREARSPIDGQPIGRVIEADAKVAGAAMRAAAAGFPQWAAIEAGERASCLDRAADLFEARRGRFLGLLIEEGGKTIDDALSELRETVDFCRFYAAEARRSFIHPVHLPGPTGEENRLGYRGRGVFVCIAPWNFPLAIFTGQVAAALAAGNAVVAKPAEQTPLVAAEAVRLLHEAGVPPGALQLVLGAGDVGAALVADPAVAGVAFTGSTETAWRINRALAAKDGPIVPLIAETGGINAMIVDATALPEQVADDVVASAFRSAGQRCSALRLLCLQEEVADRMLDTIVGAARELQVGDPRDVATDIGPIIDAESHERLAAHLAKMRGRIRFSGSVETAPKGGAYLGPQVIELDKPRDLEVEVFGPVLHVVRFSAAGLDGLLDDLAANGYGLTLGVHSRIASTLSHVVERMPAGNVYVNRTMIGAVVGTQPFGGVGLSGTGPKAGGPNYLRRFAAEQVLSVNTSAAGGNATLLLLDEGHPGG